MICKKNLDREFSSNQKQTSSNLVNIVEPQAYIQSKKYV